MFFLFAIILALIGLIIGKSNQMAANVAYGLGILLYLVCIIVREKKQPIESVNTNAVDERAERVSIVSKNEDPANSDSIIDKPQKEKTIEPVKANSCSDLENGKNRDDRIKRGEKLFYDIIKTQPLKIEEKPVKVRLTEQFGYHNDTYLWLEIIGESGKAMWIHHCGEFSDYTLEKSRVIGEYLSNILLCSFEESLMP